jgi:hypothetical protein
MSTIDHPGIILTFAHHHPGLVIIGCAAAGVYGAGYEIKQRADRGMVTGKDVMGALLMLPAAAVVAGLLLNTGLTVRVLAALTALLTVCWVTFLLMMRRTRRRNRLHYQPLHQAIGNAAGHDGDTRPRDYLTIAKDLSQVTVRMTPEAAANSSSISRIKHTMPQVLQLGECKIDEQLHGPHPKLLFRAVPPAAPMPGRLAVGDIIPRLSEAPGPKMIVQGIAGNDQLIVADFSRVVHELISAATGSGKSNKTTFTLMQFLEKGAVGIVIDPTGMSYPWAKGLPNVFYARDDADVRRACYWIDGEIKRRDEFVRDHSDLSGFVEGGFGPDLIVVADEKNLMERRLNADWQAIPGNKGRDPALSILDDVHFAGRKIGVHAVVPMVRGDAKASGGGTVRGQAQLIDFGPNPKQAEWDMFFKGDPKPECREVPPPPGRMQCCFGGGVHEIQVPHCLEVPGQNASAAEREHALEIARMVKEYALSGTVTPVPDDLLVGLQQYPDSNTELREPTAPTAVEGNQVTISEAAGNLVAMTRNQLRWASLSDEFPEPSSKRGAANLYRRTDIIAWESARISRGQEPPPEERSNVIQAHFPRQEDTT